MKRPSTAVASYWLAMAGVASDLDSLAQVIQAFSTPRGMPAWMTDEGGFELLGLLAQAGVGNWAWGSVPSAVVFGPRQSAP